MSSAVVDAASGAISPGDGRECRHDGAKMRGRLITLETFIIDSFTKIEDDGVERDFGGLQVSLLPIPVLTALTHLPIHT